MIGFESYTEDGKLQISSEDLHYFLRGSGSALSTTRQIGNTTPSTVDVAVSLAYSNPFVALRCANPVGLVYCFVSGSSRIWRYACGGPPGTQVDYQVYDSSNSFAPQGSFGMELYTPAGELAWSSSMKPARMVRLLTPGSPSATLPAGRDYFAAGCVSFAGNRTAGTMQAFLNGQLVQNPEDNPNPDYVWRYRQNAKVTGCSVDGRDVAHGAISFDDVQINAGRSATEPEPSRPNWTRSQRTIVLDGTGY